MRHSILFGFCLGVNVLLAGCGSSSNGAGMAKVSGPTKAQVDKTLQAVAAKASNPDLKKALSDFSDSASDAQKIAFLNGKSRIDLATISQPETSCRPKSCHVTVKCHPNWFIDNSCDDPVTTCDDIDPGDCHNP